MEAADLLLDRGAKINKGDAFGVTPLMRACCAGRANVVSLLLARGADPTEVSGASWTALIEAAYGAERPGSDHVAVIRMLLDDGRILVDDRTEAGATALAWACSHGHTERVRVLLVEGRAHHRLADCRGIKPWILARFAGHEDCVRLIDVSRQRESMQLARNSAVALTMT